MQVSEILEIGRQLKVRAKMTDLLVLMREKRPTLSRDTIYRAFNEPDCDTELLNEIRREGRRLIQENEVAVAA